MGYLLDNCLFERLTPELIDRCQSYTCSKDPDIDSFFHKDTKNNFEDYALEKMGYSHCFCTNENTPRMVCAFSLSNSALRTDILPNRRRNKFNKSIPNAKRRSQYPALLIGQLCVFDGFGYKIVNEHIGDEMMDLIKTMALNPDNDSAARYVVVDAINEPNVIDYYKRNGFDFLFESDIEELECLRNHKSANSIISYLKNFFGIKKQKEAISCKTRLMLFDLVLLKP